MKHLGTHIQNVRASHGQIMILVAFFAVVLTGMVGMSIDLGFTFAQRRSVQNAADAGAIAGVRALTKWSSTNPYQTADTDVAAAVNSNKMGSRTTQTYTCNYLDDSGTDLGPCTAVVPPTATGVHVVVHETHPTFFIQIVPFAPHSASTSASATAHAQGIVVDSGGLGTDSPFIICGDQTALTTGGTMSILLPDGSIDPNAYGKTFYIHGPHQIALCGATPQDFKGLADNDANYGLPIPGLFNTTNGTVTGPTQVTIDGIDGCAPGTTYKTADGCVLIVPIASQYVDGKMYIVTVAPFLITNCHVNCHEGTLIPGYVIQPTGLGQWTSSNGWLPGDPGMVDIRLTS